MRWRHFGQVRRLLLHLQKTTACEVYFFELGMYRYTIRDQLMTCEFDSLTNADYSAKVEERYLADREAMRRLSKEWIGQGIDKVLLQRERIGADWRADTDRKGTVREDLRRVRAEMNERSYPLDNSSG